MATFPTTGPWKRDKGVKHSVTPEFRTGQDWPVRIRIRSALFMSGVFQHILQDLYVYNEPYGRRKVVFQMRWALWTTVPSAARRARDVHERSVLGVLFADRPLLLC